MRWGMRWVLFILRNRLPWAAIEVKSGEQPVANSFKYFLDKVQFPYAFRMSLKSTREMLPQKVGKSKIRLLLLAGFLGDLP